MTDSRWWRNLDAVVAAELPAGSRILDVGCGDGGLVDRLAGLGFDALGVDPAAPAHPRLIQNHVEHVAGLGGFDAITAIMSLHHAELDAVVRALAELLRPGGRLFMYEFSWDAYDGRAAAWLTTHDSPEADNSVAAWRREHEGLHTGTVIKDAIFARLEPVHEVGRPYLARMLARDDLEAVEHALTDARMLPALGFWVIARRTAK